jgi:acyl-CoA thioesterase-1
LKKNPDIVFIALGANDGLRGLDLQESQNNLEQIIQTAKKAGAKVVLAGMLIPPNYGPAYSKSFKAMYKTLKTKHELSMLPFLLEGVAGEKKYNQSDGIHPNAKGHEIIADNVFEFIKEDL